MTIEKIQRIARQPATLRTLWRSDSILAQLQVAFAVAVGKTGYLT